MMSVIYILPRTFTFTVLPVSILVSIFKIKNSSLLKSVMMFGNSRVMYLQNVDALQIMMSLSDFKSTFYVFLNFTYMAADVAALANFLLM